MENKKIISTSNGKLALYIVALLILSAVTAICGAMLLENSWKAITNVWKIIPLSIGAFLGYVIVFIYMHYILRKDKIQCGLLKGFLIIFSVMFVAILLSVTIYSYYSPYAMPIALVGLMVALLLRQRLGFMSLFVTSLICALMFAVDGARANSFIGIFITTITGIFMIFLIRQGYTRFRLTIGTMLIALAMIVPSVLFAFVEEGFNMDLLFKPLEVLLGNIAAIAIFTMALPLYELVTRMWTDFKLAEVCSLNQPLLKELREKAPGTFNHSLTVANLVENCAMAIGINPYMARACAYFHDVGKMKNPQFFVENQRDGYNPHDELIPEISASMIIRHTKNGEDILRSNHMPDEVIKAAAEHHGDTPVMYFYLKAKTITEGDLNMNEYRYEGPLPSTKYSALVMICDICEALTRSKQAMSQEELEETIGKVIKEKLLDGQFDKCEITVRDMAIIKNTICDTLPAISHKRIDYNKAKEAR
ncbi:MAG: HDIG domain-containing protein [Clostridia bacterium]